MINKRVSLVELQLTVLMTIDVLLMTLSSYHTGQWEFTSYTALQHNIGLSVTADMCTN